MATTRTAGKKPLLIGDKESGIKRGGPTSKEARKPRVMFRRFKAVLQFEGYFAAALPRTPEEIKAMLEARMPSKKPVDAVPLEELAEQVTDEVGAQEVEEVQPGWATFKRDESGLYYEGRCVRGHIKDCAGAIAKFVGQGEDLSAFKAKVAQHVYVEEHILPLGRKDIEGTELRFIQVMTRKGPRSTYKYIDWVMRPCITFTLYLLNDGIITPDHIRMMFQYGAVHGMGQERSQGWGRYALGTFEEIL